MKKSGDVRDGTTWRGVRNGNFAADRDARWKFQLFKTTREEKQRPSQSGELPEWTRETNSTRMDFVELLQAANDTSEEVLIGAENGANTTPVRRALHGALDELGGGGDTTTNGTTHDMGRREEDITSSPDENNMQARENAQTVTSGGDPVAKLRQLFDHVRNETERMHRLTAELNPRKRPAANNSNFAATGSNFFFMSNAELVTRLLQGGEMAGGQFGGGSSAGVFGKSGEEAGTTGTSSSGALAGDVSSVAESAAKNVNPAEGGSSSSCSSSGGTSGNAVEGGSATALPNGRSAEETSSSGAAAGSKSSLDPAVQGGKEKKSRRTPASPRTPFHALKLFKFLPDKVRRAVAQLYLAQEQRRKAKEENTSAEVVGTSSSSTSSATSSSSVNIGSSSKKTALESPRTLLAGLPAGRKFVLHSEELLAGFFYEFVLWVEDSSSLASGGTEAGEAASGREEGPQTVTEGETTAASQGDHDHNHDHNRGGNTSLTDQAKKRKVVMGWAWRYREKVESSRGRHLKKEESPERKVANLKEKLPTWLSDLFFAKKSTRSEEQNPLLRINVLLEEANEWWTARNELLDSALRDVKTRLLVWLQQQDVAALRRGAERGGCRGGGQQGRDEEVEEEESFRACEDYSPRTPPGGPGGETGGESRRNGLLSTKGSVLNSRNNFGSTATRKAKSNVVSTRNNTQKPKQLQAKNSPRNTVEKFFASARSLEAAVEADFESVRDRFDFAAVEKKAVKKNPPQKEASRKSIAARRRGLSSTSNSPLPKTKTSQSPHMKPGENPRGRTPQKSSTPQKTIERDSAAESPVEETEEQVLARLLQTCDLNRCRSQLAELTERFDGRVSSFDRDHSAVLRIGAEVVEEEESGRGEVQPRLLLELRGRWEWQRFS